MKVKKKKYNKSWTIVWSKRPYPPYLMALATRATVFGLRRIFPMSRINQGINYWNNQENSYIYLGNELVKTVDIIFQKAVTSPVFLMDLFKKSYIGAKNLNIFSQKFNSLKLNKISSKDLIKLIIIFYDKFYNFYACGTIPSLTGYCENNYLYREMDRILKKKIRVNPEKYAQSLVVLTEIPKPLKSQQQELAILKLARKAKKSGIYNKKDLLKKFKKELGKIKEQFGWLEYDLYDAPGADINHYGKKVTAKSRLSLAEINRQIFDLENFERLNKVKFSGLVKKLKLSSREKNIFNLVRNLGYYKWLREFEFLRAIFNLKIIQNELAKRFGFTNKEIKYLLPEELKCLLETKDNKLIISAKKRMKNFLILIQRGKKDKLFEGSKAKAEFKKLNFVKEKVEEAANELKGMPAFAGKATGIVKIVNNVRHLPKIKKGEILVSVSTNPDLLSGMKKSAAIVTDEGGITCHAAIVSRELKIPCIVGVKMATKVLKDGDRVEVDAERGIIKKI